MNWIDIEKVHPDQIIDWDKVEGDTVSILAFVHYGEGSPDISIEDLVRPDYRGEEYGAKDNGFCLTGSMSKITHWMPLPGMPQMRVGRITR
jgi:hypothetical protein